MHASYNETTSVRSQSGRTLAESWVNLPVDLVLSREFAALSPEAVSVWVRAWTLAKKCDADGFLAEGDEPVPVTRLHPPELSFRVARRAIEELVSTPFPGRDDGVGFLQRLICDGADVLLVTGWKRAQRGDVEA